LKLIYFLVNPCNFRNWF